jgi:excisionase family DNA binding protein
MEAERRLTVTVDECAALAGLSRNTAYSLVAKKVIPSVRLGKRILIPRRGLERLLAGEIAQAASNDTSKPNA